MNINDLQWHHSSTDETIEDILALIRQRDDIAARASLFARIKVLLCTQPGGNACICLDTKGERITFDSVEQFCRQLDGLEEWILCSATVMGLELADCWRLATNGK